MSSAAPIAPPNGKTRRVAALQLDGASALCAIMGDIEELIDLVLMSFLISPAFPCFDSLLTFLRVNTKKSLPVAPL